MSGSKVDTSELLPQKKGNWRTVVLNANGLTSNYTRSDGRKIDKRANLAALLDYTNPDAIIITETKIDSNVASAEILPCGYLESKPIRCDRNSNGGGVLIAVRDGLTLSEIQLPETPAEIIWGEVTLRGSSKLILGGYYRTPSGHAVTQQEEFESSLKNLKKYVKNGDTIILGGDFNFKDVDWNTDTVPPGVPERKASQMLVSSLNDHHLIQQQREPTRQNNILDLYITNKPSLTKCMNTVPNISDHEGAILVDGVIKASFTKKKPKKYHLFSKAIGLR